MATLQQAIDTLPADDLIIVLAVRRLKSTRLAADELNLTQGRVKHRLYHSVQNLRAFTNEADKLLEGVDAAPPHAH